MPELRECTLTTPRGSPDDEARAFGVPVHAVEQGVRGREGRGDDLEWLAVGDLAAVVPSQHFRRVQPRAVGRRVEPHRTAGGAAWHGLDFLTSVRAGVVPGDGRPLAGVLDQRPLERLGRLASALARVRA